MFRVEKFEKSYSVVEAEDLKIECKVTNRTSEIDIKNDVLIKWYMYNSTGDESTFLPTIGNCSEDQQARLNWHEVIVDKGKKNWTEILSYFIFNDATIIKTITQPFSR